MTTILKAGTTGKITSCKDCKWCNSYKKCTNKAVEHIRKDEYDFYEGINNTYRSCKDISTARHSECGINAKLFEPK